jgi:hypothetical protein
MHSVCVCVCSLSLSLSLSLRQVVYNMLWACNVALHLCALGLYTRRPVLVFASMVSIGVDQAPWYIDVGGWAVTGTFPVGVAKYLTWPETTLTKKLTSAHHLWFMPLAVWCIRSVQWNVGWETLGVSMAIIFAEAVVSRAMVPFEIEWR